jgi:hypothetical protein
MAILDLFAKQIIHRTLGHAEFDATYAKLRAELADAEPQANIPTPEEETGTLITGDPEGFGGQDTNGNHGLPADVQAVDLAAPGELNIAT